MIKQDTSLRRPAEIIAVEVKLAPGETTQELHQAWLAKQLAKERFCKTHHNVNLLYAPGWFSGVSQAYDEPYYHQDPQILKPGVYVFRAAFHCPICRCIYALFPPEFHHANFGTFDTSTAERANALKCCRQFADQINQVGNGFAVLVGNTGNGKTRLAASILAALDNVDALYVRQGQLTIELRAAYGRKDVFIHNRKATRDEDEDDDEPPTILEIVQSVRVLVLDELGCSPLANDERLLLDELLKHRYEQRKPTILISNLALDQLKEFLGDALADRIKHATGNGRFILQFDGESFRRATGEDYLAGLK